MTIRVAFYLLNTSANDQIIDFGVRLIRKIYNLPKSILLMADSDLLQQFDQALWQQPHSFLAHNFVSSNNPAPILLQDTDSSCQQEILVRCDPNSQVVVDSCQRIAELVPDIPAIKSQARQRYRQYQQLQFNIQTHNR